MNNIESTYIDFNIGFPNKKFTHFPALLNDLQVDNLKGEIHQIHELINDGTATHLSFNIKKEYHENGNIKSITYYHLDQTVKQLIKFIYNKNNELIQQNSNLGYKTDIVYDCENNQIRIVRYVENTIHKNVQIIEFNENGLVSSESSKGANSNYKNDYFYNNFGKCHTEIQYHNNKLEFKKTFVYSDLGILKSSSLLQSFQGVDYISYQTYDDHENCISDSFNQMNAIFKYDQNNNLLLWKTERKKPLVNKFQEKVTTYSIEYKYDNYGNWIKKTTFENEILNRIIRRKITYYNN